MANALDATRDLFETLTIDLADLDGFARDILVDPAALPRWTLWRQDDNGAHLEVASFTGRRKAEATLRRHDSLHPGQTCSLTVVHPDEGPRRSRRPAMGHLRGL